MAWLHRGCLLLGAVLAAFLIVVSTSEGPHQPGVSRRSDAILDPAARGVITYENTANIASYQQDGILTYRGWQYTGWYRDSERAVIARRQLPSGRWQSTELDVDLYRDDSHNTIAMAVTSSDGRLHVAFPTHNEGIRYTRTRPGVASRPGEIPWTSRVFERTRPSWPGAPEAPRTLTYPRFEVVRGRMLLTYRDGISGNGQQVLLRYDDTPAGTWSFLGSYTSSQGTYRSKYGTSTTRNAYLHGFTADPATGDLAITWTWREHPSGSCDGASVGNHDTGYAVSHDGGMTWTGNHGRVIGRTGTRDLIAVHDPHIVRGIPIDRGLMNQESQAFDHEGRLHVMTSRVRASDLHPLGGCARDLYADRRRFARPYHAWRDDDGTWHETALPTRQGSSGRTKIVLGNDDTAYVILPDARIMAATAASRWTDWRTVFAAGDVRNVSELIIDRSRLALDGVLSVAYQEPPRRAGLPSAFRIADFHLGSTAPHRPKSRNPERPPLPYEGSRRETAGID
ncbi:BNR repeat-containing protein [Actinopolymorpha sp. B17G11]|uniref:BNR repeat-containing protein n=1 Tax=Actinopolymorpha sp. B17G11 TaxID=3160861 RepID=UPI0032E4CA5C